MLGDIFLGKVTKPILMPSISDLERLRYSLKGKDIFNAYKRLDKFLKDFFLKRQGCKVTALFTYELKCSEEYTYIDEMIESAGCPPCFTNKYVDYITFTTPKNDNIIDLGARRLPFALFIYHDGSRVHEVCYGLGEKYVLQI